MFDEQQIGDFAIPGAPARATLSKLDRAVSNAISGSSYALEELRILWPALLAELPADIAEKTRDQYLTAAIAIWNRYRAGELPDAEQAAAALDVMCLLFDE
jgi:hypothetical protein